MSQQQTWTPEPWHACDAHDGQCPCQGIMATDGTTIAHFYGDDSYSIEGVTVQCPNLKEGHANRFRIVACVNALAGIPDPAAFVKAVDEFVKEFNAAMSLVAAGHEMSLGSLCNAVSALRLARGEVKK